MHPVTDFLGRWRLSFGHLFVGGAPVGYEVTGVDFSENMLRLATKNVPRAKFVEKNMTELDFETESFDGLTAFYSIIHVRKEKHFQLFRRFHRILKPEGIMLICLGPDD